MQDCSISTALAVEILQSCTKPLIYLVLMVTDLPNVTKIHYTSIQKMNAMLSSSKQNLKSLKTQNTSIDNSLAPGVCGWNPKLVIFKLIKKIDILRIDFMRYCPTTFQLKSPTSSKNYKKTIKKGIVLWIQQIYFKIKENHGFQISVIRYCLTLTPGDVFPWIYIILFIV